MNKFYLLLVSFTLICSQIVAQGHYPVIAMEIQSTPVANHITNGQPDISDSTMFNVNMRIVLSDTASAQTLQVNLKRDEADQSILFSKNFSFDVSGNFPDGTSYSRSGYEVTLGLGVFMGTIRPYAELIVSNISGNVTDPVIYY